MGSKFDFYEIVKVVSDNPNIKVINGLEGVIVGKEYDEGTSRWSYGVKISAENGLVWRIYEEELSSLGKIADAKELYTSKTIRVAMDPITREGTIKEPASD